MINPQLRDLKTIFEAGVPTLYGDIGEARLMPLALLGDGMGRLARLAIHLSLAPGGVVLVDEIDNGLHYSAMKKIWKAIGDLSRKLDLQIFATTHSMECIRSAHKAFEESSTYDFRLHRLQGKGEDLKAITYNRETLATAIDMDLEVR